MLYECDQLEPSPPAEWLSHLDDCTQQAYWMRGVIPAAWTGILERVSEGLLAGLWAETEKVDGAQFFFGVDASGGSRSNDPRTRLCSWGISAVALSATGEWHRLKKGLLKHGRSRRRRRTKVPALREGRREAPRGPIAEVHRSRQGSLPDWRQLRGHFRKGLYVFKKTGDSYEGKYEENRKHGFGKMTYRNNVGEEEDADPPDENAPPRGGSYLGNFTAGLRGRLASAGPEAPADGTFTYVNGDAYAGQWREGKKHGNGTYTFAKDGTQLVGEWEDGKIVSGKWVFPNGTFYCGKFRYNKPYGKGVWVFKNGNQLAGDYLQKEQATEDEPADETEGAPKPDPKVWRVNVLSKDGCIILHSSATMAREMPEPRVQAFYMTVKSILQERGRRPEIPIHAEFHGVLDSTLFGG
eukprot:s312_g10.t1